MARLSDASSAIDILLVFDDPVTPAVRTERTVPSLKVTVTVAPIISSPEMLAECSGPGPAAPFTLVGSMSAEKVIVVPGPKSTEGPQVTRSTS